MRILIVAATEEEIKDLSPEISHPGFEIKTLITGVGIAATAYSLTKALCYSKYDLAINIGLAGSFRDEIKTGDVVAVVTDAFSDLGAEDGENFLSVFDLGLQGRDRFPFRNGKLKCNTDIDKYKSLEKVKRVSSITVNTVHGNDDSISKVIQLYHPDIESMEGAAFFYVCMMEKVPCFQIRAISNRVEKRNRNAWNIPLAMQNLAVVVKSLFEELSLQPSKLG
jgi:futalosine hydrolase